MSFVDHWASGPRSVETGRTPTEASRKCVVTVRKESIASSFSSSSTVEFRGLEGSDTKAENWSATGSRQIAEDDRELNHTVSENKSPPDVSIVCSIAVKITLDRSTVRYAARGHPLSRWKERCSMHRHLSTVEVRQQHLPVAPSAPSAKLSRVPSPRRRISVALGSMWPKFLTLPTSKGQMDLARKMIIGNQLRLLLRLLVVSCLLHLQPFIYLELS